MKPENVSFTYVGQSDLAPMTTLVPFGINSSSSQLLDLLQALRLGHFYFFPSFISRLPIKKIYSITQTFKTPTTYLTLQLPTSTPLKTLNLIDIQTLPL
jgi:hypothetical protein